MTPASATVLHSRVVPSESNYPWFKPDHFNDQGLKQITLSFGGGSCLEWREPDMNQISASERQRGIQTATGLYVV